MILLTWPPARAASEAPPRHRRIAGETDNPERVIASGAARPKAHPREPVLLTHSHSVFSGHEVGATS